MNTFMHGIRIEDTREAGAWAVYDDRTPFVVIGKTTMGQHVIARCPLRADAEEIAGDLRWARRKTVRA